MSVLPIHSIFGHHRQVQYTEQNSKWTAYLELPRILFETKWAWASHAHLSVQSEFSELPIKHIWYCLDRQFTSFWDIAILSLHLSLFLWVILSLLAPCSVSLSGGWDSELTMFDRQREEGSITNNNCEKERERGWKKIERMNPSRNHLL